MEYVSLIQSPILGVVFFGCIALVMLVYLCYRGLLSVRALHERHFVARIRLPEISQSEEEQALTLVRDVFDSLFTHVLSQTDTFFFEIVKTDPYITIQIGSNKKEILEHARHMFLHIEHIDVSQTQEDVLAGIKSIWVNTISTSETYFPMTKNTQFFELVITLLSRLPQSEQAGIQVIFRGVRAHSAFLTANRAFSQNLATHDRWDKETQNHFFSLLAQKQEENLFKTKILVFATEKPFLTSLSSLFSLLNYRQNKFVSQKKSITQITRRFLAADLLFARRIPFWRESGASYLTSSELAILMHPIHTKHATYAPKQGKNLEAIPELLVQTEKNIRIGTSGNRTIYFPVHNFERHIYLVGKTGRGKSTLLVSLFAGIQNKGGNTWIIDPHGDLLHDAAVSLDDLSRVYYFNAEGEDIFTINPLFAFGMSSLQKGVIKDMLLDIIKRETEEQTGGYQSGSMTQNRIEQLLEIAIEFPDAYFDFLLKKGVAKQKAEELVQTRQLTLNDLPYLLVPEYNYLPLLRAVFTNDSPIGRYVSRQLSMHQNQQAVVEAVQSRMKQLLHSSLLYVFEGNGFDIQRAITSENTFLFPLQRSVFGTRGTHILMQVLFSLIWNNKQEKEGERKPTYMFIDEFHHAQISDIPDIIAEGRKYQLFLTLSNQQLGQLQKSVKDAILGNIGTIISFAVGADEIGAKTLAPYFGSDISEGDLTMLPPFQAYLKTEGSKEKPSVTLSFQTIPPREKDKDKDTQILTKLHKKTIKKFGENKKVLEERLNRKQENPLKYFTEGITLSS